jgi:hypothetical protein
MPRLLRYLVPALCLFAGAVGGAIASALFLQHITLLNDFSRTMQVRFLAADSMTGVSSRDITLRLLDMYENGIRRQIESSSGSKPDWEQELIDINLRRYVLLSADHREASAEQAIISAARIKSKGQAPAQTDVEFCKQLADRLYGLKP